MFIYDSSKKKKLKFEPEEKVVRIYICGPTVYDFSHLGHARSAVVFDLLIRVLKASGYEVCFARNFTDIDDKIIKKMQIENKSLEEITNFYIKAFHEDMEKLNTLKPDFEPRATDYIEKIISFVSNLMQNGYAYKSNDGIYFDTNKDKLYLSLSNQNLDNSIARVEENNSKKNFKDFALWKNSKPNEPSYKSSFGDGRPGWHIECSVMIDEIFALNERKYQVDIHAGGADLIFPHHENEAAQSRCKNNKEIAKYWLHNGFVNINNQKMSKSLNNSFFLKDAFKLYHGEIIRFYLLLTHYRLDFNYNIEDLNLAKKRLDKFYRLKKRLQGKVGIVNKTFKQNLLTALQDDLNISVALSYAEEMIAKANDLLDKTANKAQKQEILANLNFIAEIFGILSIDTHEYFQLGLSDEEKEQIKALIIKRGEYKKQKDYKQADIIREKLDNLGVSIQDTQEGTIWEKKSN